ncbi:MAG: LCP family protein [Tissierellales bacterium]|nr:LCP family protein [Tissierellales bacterium]
MKSFIKIFLKWLIIFIVLFFFLNFLIGASYDDSNLTFLFMGVDASNVKEAKGVRSDTIMLINVDKNKDLISIISIPRDTRTPIEGRKYEEKINHAYAYGGPTLTTKTVSNLLGINIDYYAVVDYDLVSQFIDLIGGVEIYVPIDMKYQDPVANPPLYIDLQEGLQVLDGDKALQYLRFRKGYANADLGRIDAQQEFLKVLINETLSLKNIPKIPSMIKLYKTNVDTNIPVSMALRYGLSTMIPGPLEIESHVLPGSPKMINGISYYIHDKQETQRLIQQVIYSDK